MDTCEDEISTFNTATYSVLALTLVNILVSYHLLSTILSVHLLLLQPPLLSFMDSSVNTNTTAMPLYSPCHFTRTGVPLLLSKRFRSCKLKRKSFNLKPSQCFLSRRVHSQNNRWCTVTDRILSNRLRWSYHILPIHLFLVGVFVVVACLWVPQMGRTIIQRQTTITCFGGTCCCCICRGDRSKIYGIEIIHILLHPNIFHHDLLP